MSEGLQQRLDEQRSRSTAKRPPEVTEAIARAIESVRAVGIVDGSVPVGGRAPDFSLPDVHGREIRLGDLLGRGPVVLAFYRGVW